MRSYIFKLHVNCMRGHRQHSHIFDIDAQALFDAYSLAPDAMSTDNKKQEKGNGFRFLPFL